MTGFFFAGRLMPDHLRKALLKTDVKTMEETTIMILVAKIRAKQGKEKDLETALTGLIKAVETEEGTLQYILHNSLTDPQSFMFYEVYKDRDALTKHSTTDYFKETMKTVSLFLEGKPEIETFREISRINKAQ